MSKNHFPTRNDKVNDNTRRPPYANGFVQRVLYEDGPSEVLVDFGNEIVSYDFSEFRYTWTEKYNGCYILGNHPTIHRSKS